MDDEIKIRPLQTSGEMKQVEELQQMAWPGSKIEIIPIHLLMAIAHNGGSIIGALEGEKVIGFVLGFLGTDTGRMDQVTVEGLKHCSHQIGVHPMYHNQGLEYRLKLAQRLAVIEQGISLITWRYDPLLCLDAHLNIRQLGAICSHYIRDAYDSMEDDLNVDLPSDRFQVDWWVTTARVVSRLEGTRRPLNLSDYLDAGTQVLNPAIFGDKNLLHPTERWVSPEGNLVLVEIPENYQLIKKIDIGLAKAWRLHTCEILEGAFNSGYIVTDFVSMRDEQLPRSYYVLAHSERTLAGDED